LVSCSQAIIKARRRKLHPADFTQLPSYCRHDTLAFTLHQQKDARKAAKPPVLQQALTAFENMMLTKHMWPQARIRLKEAWNTYILKHYAQTLANGQSHNKSKVATPPGHLYLRQPMGLVEGDGDGLLRKTKRLYPQTRVACNASYRTVLSNSGIFTKKKEINQFYAI
jgi:hypothetical protein